MYVEALGQYEQLKRQISHQDQATYSVVEQAIREELQLVEDLQAELRRIANPRPESAGECDPNDDYTFDSPSKYQKPVRVPPRVNVPAAAKIESRINNQQTPSSKFLKEQRNRDQQAKQDNNKPDKQDNKSNKYDKPWKQEEKPVKPGKPKSDLPTSYEGVDARFVEEIHGIMIKDTGVKFGDIAGLEDAKRLLTEAIILPMQIPELFTGPMAPWRGVLLYGPPGTGKTELAKAFATEAKCCFFAASASTIMSKYVGDSEKVVKALFTIARFHAPAIIFMDEIDAIMSTNSSSSDNPVGPRLRQEILTQMCGVGTTNGVTQHVVVLAATNHPWNLDEALRRRLEKRIYLPLPEVETRKQLLELKLRGVNVGLEIDYQLLAERLKGYSGSDIQLIVREALMNQVRKVGVEELARNKEKYINNMKVGMDDFEAAIACTKPSVAETDIARYLKFQKDFASM